MINQNSRQIEKTILVAVFTTFMGQIYFAPFGTEFRLTFAVVVLNILMLTFKEIKPLPTINLVGLLMFFVRSSVFVFNQNGTYLEAFQIYYPVVFFYIFYSIFFVLLDVRSFLKNPLILFLSIWICDSIPNIIEVIVRREWQSANFEHVIYTIIIIGLFRTIFTTILIYISNYYLQHIKERQNHQKFVEKIVLMSSLKTELFFLRKSKNDIEDAMRRSFEIYEKIQDGEEKTAILTVAKDIHEIKKDYTRVIAGIEKSIEETSSFQMSFFEILSIVTETNQKLAESKGKKIKFEISKFYNFKTNEYFALISVLNNLVVNAIEAIEHTGLISIYENLKDELIFISVYDDGIGIEEMDLNLIFEPGYSTKYNEINGIMSSGIGLTHVKYLVEDILEGKLVVESQKGISTKFDIVIPKICLVSEREDTENQQ
ncbi:sensor histidine kinase [Fusibacter ferrireducens]|uniref:histidine kinase n=1 Tax=Fusibacter ferrireducens TaxID=2785058 RepID=A0ABR9ZT71_9FIRM|nr:ATP-binding protein [Fusibacter ferrireducens]MBF4693635.1 ATP-binding protein [Fusibacter ferrireducens]